MISSLILSSVINRIVMLQAIGFDKQRHFSLTVHIIAINCSLNDVEKVPPCLEVEGLLFLTSFAACNLTASQYTHTSVCCVYMYVYLLSCIATGSVLSIESMICLSQSCTACD